MNAREAERLLAAADPVAAERLDGLDFEAMEADLLADVEGGRAALAVEPARRSHPRRRLVLALGTAAFAAALVLIVVLAGSGSESGSRAYGAEQIAFAEATPLLLLDGPGWRVQNVTESKTREGTEGQMEFVTGKPIPYETLRITGNDEEGERVEGLAPAATRQRKVELRWRAEAEESLGDAIARRREYPHPHGRRFVRLPVLGTTAFVDTRPEIFLNQGGPGDREMLALWSEDDYLLEMHAAVPDLAGMEERLGWLTKVDSQTWLDAMPAKVVKAADHEAVVAEMLKGIPLPKTFAPSRVPNEGLTTDRYQVGAKVTGTVACLWLRQWGAATRSGDTAAAEEAVRAMATARHWPILRKMDADGDYPEVLWEDAAAMPQGYFDWNGHHRDLLAHAESLGCARLGLPLMPEKMRRQRERGVPAPPD
ncbi:MAG TPA: hypothetical protein VMF55_06755 [Solirubrobacterales bacterium]|nr:hypothetical protein [Solirubrobacterales bacterium]